MAICFSYVWYEPTQRLAVPPSGVCRDRWPSGIRATVTVQAGQVTMGGSTENRDFREE